MHISTFPSTTKTFPGFVMSPTVTEVDLVVERSSNSSQKPGGVGGTVLSVVSVGGTVPSVGPSENVGVTNVPGETVKRCKKSSYMYA